MSSHSSDHLNTASAIQSRRLRAAQIAHCHEQGMHASILRRGSFREHHITIEPLPEESIRSMISRLMAFIRSNQATIVRQEVFGSCESYSEFINDTSRSCSKVNWPITWAEGLPCEHTGIAGIHTMAVSGSEVETLYEGDRPIGTSFWDGSAKHCILGDLVPSAPQKSRAEQTKEIFQTMSRHLQDAGMELKSVARTWFYLNQILDWYKEFNTARREIFEKFNLFSRWMPASTGIGARNKSGAGLVAGAWAVQPKTEEVNVSPIDSPLQCSARDYGSCFSRAMEIAAPALRRLFVSGTASIAADGSTAFTGDIRGQVALTMEVMEAILQSRKMGWNDVTRATAYLKRKEDAWAFAEFELEHELKMPVLVTEADVCRDDLLFEIEVDAVSSKPLNPSSNWNI